MAKINLNGFVTIQASLSQARKLASEAKEARDNMAQEIADALIAAGQDPAGFELPKCPGFNGETVKLRQKRLQPGKYYLFVPSENVKPEVKNPRAKKGEKVSPLDIFASGEEDSQDDDQVLAAE